MFFQSTTESVNRATEVFSSPLRGRIKEGVLKQAHSFQFAHPYPTFPRQGLCRNSVSAVSVSLSVISTAGRNPCFDQREKSFLDPSHSFGMTARPRKLRHGLSSQIMTIDFNHLSQMPTAPSDPASPRNRGRFSPRRRQARSSDAFSPPRYRRRSNSACSDPTC